MNKNAFVEQNLGLAYDAALRHYRRVERFGVDLDDLRQVAVEGLIAAAERREHVRGAFSTYARTCIDRAILSHLETEIPYACMPREVPENDDQEPPQAASDVRREAAAFLDGLPETHRQVLRLSFGVDCDALTSGEIGQRLGVCASRVRQLKAEALEMCRTLG